VAIGSAAGDSRITASSGVGREAGYALPSRS
jgi:hypothetical protein